MAMAEQEVISVQHVPVVASFQWDKLIAALLSLGDRLANQALHISKVDEQVQGLATLKDELNQIVKAALKEMDATKEHQKKWLESVEEHLQNLQKGQDQNTNRIDQLVTDVDIVQKIDAAVHLLQSRVDAFEKAAEIVHSSTQPSDFDEIIKSLHSNVEEHTGKIQNLEEHNQHLKLLIEQTARSHGSEIDALQSFSKNLQSALEIKHIVGVTASTAASKSSPTEEISSLEAAVAELQRGLDQKANSTTLDHVSRISEITKNGLEKMESTILEIQLQLQRISSGSRRSSIGFSSMSLDNQDLQQGENSASLKKVPVNNQIKEVTEEKLSKITKDVGIVGKGLLVMSGLDKEGSQFFVDASGSIESHGTIAVQKEDRLNNNLRDTTKALASQDQSNNNLTDTTKALASQVAALDDDTVLQVIDDALKRNKLEPKENASSLGKVIEHLSSIASRVEGLESLTKLIGENLTTKADKADLQKLAGFVKAQLQRPENALFTSKPLLGFKCLSCEHPLSKLHSLPSGSLPSNRMPPQILTMLSAERIYAMDKRNLSEVRRLTSSLCRGQTHSLKYSPRAVDGALNKGSAAYMKGRTSPRLSAHPPNSKVQGLRESPQMKGRVSPRCRPDWKVQELRGSPEMKGRMSPRASLNSKPQHQTPRPTSAQATH